MTDVMKPKIYMMPIIDLSLVDDGYSAFLSDSATGVQYIEWSTGDRSHPDVKDLNEELVRKGVPNNFNCLLKVF